MNDNDTDTPFPVVVQRRPRQRVWLFAVLASLSIVGLLPILGIAQASRQDADSRPAKRRDATGPALHHVADRPTTATLGALIEVQRREREQRRASTAAEQKVGERPASGGWQAQLGAFSSANAAERERARLIEASVPVVIRRVGSLHRLQSLPGVRAETESLCARAQAGGVDCFVRRVVDDI